MAKRGGRGLRILLGTLLLALVVSYLAELAMAQGLLPRVAVVTYIAGIQLTLAVATAATLVLVLVFQGLRTTLRLRGGRDAPQAIGAIEVGAAVVGAAFLAVVLAGGLGSALLSLGLVGFAFTLALQRPILAVAGWAAIRFGRLFREGDRIEIDGIVGDVVEVTLFKTRLWEIGSEDSPLPWGGAVSPLRATGRVVTLSNATFLEKPLANATSDISFLFDEFVVTVAYESDWKLAESLLADIAAKVIDPDRHARAAREYEALTYQMKHRAQFPKRPVVLMTLQASWIELRLRYLVDVRERSATRTALARAWQEESAKHPEQLPNVYNRVQPMAVGRAGKALEP